MSENMNQLNSETKTCGQMSGNCVDSESVANTSMSSRMEDILLDQMADKISWFERKYSKLLVQNCEIWRQLSGLSTFLMNQVMDEMLTQFTDQLTDDKNKLFL